MNAEPKADLSNWLRAPHNRWAFTHIDELMACATIPYDPAQALPFSENPSDLLKLRFHDGDNKLTDIEAMLERTDTDGFLVCQGDEILLENYRNHQEQATRHILFSASKSLTGMMAGILKERGLLRPQAPVTDYIPELAASVYGDASVRDVLDMTVGLVFDEDYVDTEGQMARYRRAIGWWPSQPGETLAGLHEFLESLKDRSGPHGQVFAYSSPNSDVLGWLIERAADCSFADLFATEIWQPMGATSDAYISIDRQGAPRTGGGISCTLRDFACFGRLVAEDGLVSGRQIVPKNWITDTRRNGQAQAWRDGKFAVYFTDWDLRYRNQWYVMSGDPFSPFFALGTYGQMLFIDPASKTVIAKQSSPAQQLEIANYTLVLHGCMAILRELS